MFMRKTRRCGDDIIDISFFFTPLLFAVLSLRSADADMRVMPPAMTISRGARRHVTSTFRLPRCACYVNALIVMLMPAAFHTAIDVFAFFMPAFLHFAIAFIIILLLATLFCQLAFFAAAGFSVSLIGFSFAFSHFFSLLFFRFCQFQTFAFRFLSLSIRCRYPETTERT